MKRRDVKSNCPVNFTMEIFGDPWSMLIVRGIVTYGASSFSDFLKSKERIGTSVLTDRLSHLEKKGIIVKYTDQADKRKTHYTLTKTGITLIPLVYEISVWGTNNSPHPDVAPAWYKAMELDREKVITAWKKAIQAGSSFYTGPSSVINQLQLV